MFKVLLIAVLSFSTMAANRSIPGEFIVKIRKGVSAKRAFSQRNLQSLYKGAKQVQGTRGRFVKVTMHKSAISQGVQAFASNPAFEYIEPNYILSLPKYQVNGAVRNTYAPADKMFKKLWGLHNSKNGHDIGALKAWKKTKGSRNVVVAVIDTGIDYNHPDLAKNIWKNTKEIPNNGIDDDGNGFVDDVHGYDFINNDSDPMDGNSHGTHCAGTIGAVHNSIGVAGVAANVKMMASKIFTDAGYTSTEAILEAIHYSVDNGAHILSNSWGGGGKTAAIRDAIKYANSKGVIFIAAAGNSNNDNDRWGHYPSSYLVDNIVAVAAHDISGKRASFSSYGEESVDVAAPGVDILSTTPGGQYKSYSGTSMATPHVSGVVALLLSLNSKWLNKAGSRRNLNVSPKDIKNLLIKTSKKHDELDNVSVSDGYVKADSLVNKVRR